MRLIAVTVLVMACGAPARPSSPAPAPPTTQRPSQVERRAAAFRARARTLAEGGHGFSRDTATWVAVLEYADALILDGVGITGETSGQVIAAREIAEQPDAKAAAEYLVRDAIGPARLYGLWILNAIDPSAAALAAVGLRNDPSPIGSIHGCEISAPVPMAALVDEVLARKLWPPGRGPSI